MKYHVILNACAEDVSRQAKEINGFIKRSELKAEKGNTIIICGGQWDGDDKQALAEMAPTNSVIFIIVEHYQPELILQCLKTLVDSRDLYLFGSNYCAIELAVRLGQRSGGSSITGCLQLKEGNGLYAQKMTYSNHLQGTFLLKASPYFISILKGQEQEKVTKAAPKEIRCFDLREEFEAQDSSFTLTKGEALNSLEEAALVVLIGRGVKKKEAAEEVRELSAKINAAFGASRPVVMNAWAPMQDLIGVSGTMIKPKICIAIGTSGAPALYSGLEKSKFIVAVNTDERAPIIKKADVAIIGDGLEMLRALAAELGKEQTDG